MTKLPSKARLAILRLRSLGDCVLTTPALRLLKASRPDIETAVVVDRAFRDVYLANPDTDHVLDSGSLAPLRQFRPDAVVNLHGGTRSAWMTAASGAKLRCGFAHFRFPFVYNLRIPRAQEILGQERPVHTAEHAASAFFCLGVPQSEIPRAHLHVDATQRSRPYAVLHPFASSAAKTWPAARFNELAHSLDLEPVFIGAATDNFEPFRQFACEPRPLPETMSLIAGASLFVGNDSGPAHLAAAFGRPVVVLFGPSNPATWAPWRTESRVIHRPDLASVSVAEVQAAIASLGVTA